MLSWSSSSGSLDTQFNTLGIKDQAKSLYSMRALHISFIQTCLLSIDLVPDTEDLVIHKTEELTFRWGGETRINTKTPSSYKCYEEKHGKVMVKDGKEVTILQMGCLGKASPKR